MEVEVKSKGKDLKVQPLKKKNNNIGQKNNKNRKKGANRRNVLRQPNLKERFSYALTHPDITGPFRIPRLGASQRTLLCADRTKHSFTGSASVKVQGGQIGDTYASALVVRTAADEASGFSTSAIMAPGSQFPAASQLADIDLVACSIVVYSNSPLLNLGGELIVGSTIPVGTSTTYSSLFYYPGVIRYPISSVLNKPIRVYGRKISEKANEFTPLGTGTSDYEFPFVWTSNLTVGLEISLEITRVWEARSTTASTLAIPYDSGNDNHSGHVLAYQDAVADIGQNVAAIAEGNPNMYPDWMGSSTSLVLGGVSLLAYGSQYAYSRFRANPVNGLFGPNIRFVHENDLNPLV